MVLGKLPVPGRPTIWMIGGQGPIALAVGAGGSCLDIFTLVYHFSSLTPSLWETARYRLKYCLKGPLNPKQLTTKILLVKLEEKDDIFFINKRKRINEFQMKRQQFLLDIYIFLLLHCCFTSTVNI